MYGDCISVMYPRNYSKFSSMIASCGDEVVNNSNHYANVIKISPEYFPRHTVLFNGCRPDEILCYTLIGSCGFLDVCPDGSDKWIRIHVENGDFMTLPGDLFHLFRAPTSNNFANNCTPSSLVRIVLAEAWLDCGLSTRSFLGRVR
mmetsp:Transcript_18713/g.27027  ORF Transcript_18713/g.27027 Transcript_18713/m.27027 type:complete len:146 (+) Transcript_18713:2286-2723(+)